MTPTELVAKWQSKFAILESWDIQYVDSCDEGGCSCISHWSEKEKKGLIFQCRMPGVSPDTYILHEMLHGVVRAVRVAERGTLRFEVDGEESVVRDLVKLILGGDYDDK